ncbi:phage tail protein [Citrobacter sp. Cs237]|uniref:phage tail protein n=1 Tax=Citrobacter sp. Cs237 TaxID=2985156 RepID=UPI0025782A78|nr:phage tail protein [Citrobacter sp. Cs237]MDM2750295.1 phage tail protein [Citrobacter sp. Cs237]
MADYYSIITNRGKELEAEALASGRPIVLTQFVVGDSNGQQIKPDPKQIRLVNETFRGVIAELIVSPDQSTQLMAKIILPTGMGGFTVREVGLLTDAGELYAVANCPAIDKPVGGVSVNMQFRLAVSDTSNITLNVATGDGLFLRIDQNLKEIKARGDDSQREARESIGILDATTQRKGLVQLNSAVNSTSETQGATPAAVRIAMDNANARLAKERNGADIPNKSLFIQNVGLKETVDKAAGAVQRSGDEMTGQLKIGATDALRIYDDAFGLIMRRSEDFLHFIPTVENQGESGGLGPLRPFSINLRSGKVSVNHGVNISGGLGLGTDNTLGGNSIALGDNDTGLKQNGDGVLDVIANNVQSMRIIRDAVQVANWSGSWINMREQRCFTGQQIVSTNSASAIVRQEHQDRHFCLGGLGNHQFGIYMINKGRTENGTDGQAFLSVEGNFQCPSGQLVPGNYGNFDARYQAKGNYTPAGQAYTKSESDARYQLKNSASKAANGWHKDATTGIITQWGYVKKAGDRNAYITFPIAFPSAVCSVVINIDGSPEWSPNLVQFVYNVSRTGCSVSAHDPDRNRGVYWMAIGY